mgnify:CR=1 FL=1
MTKVSVRGDCFGGAIETIPWEQRKPYDEFDYGYVLTVHKSQGSQWDDVVLFDESFAFQDSRARWLYTGITRAAKRLSVRGVSGVILGPPLRSDACQLAANFDNSRNSRVLPTGNNAAAAAYLRDIGRRIADCETRPPGLDCLAIQSAGNARKPMSRQPLQPPVALRRRRRRAGDVALS